MDKHSFFDLRDEPEALPPLTHHMIDKSGLLDSVVQALAVAGADPKDLLSAFSSDPILWPIPARVGEGVMGAEAQVFMPPRDRPPVKDVLWAHDKVYETIQAKGMTATSIKLLGEVFGPSATHPLLFSRLGQGNDAANLFSAEYALALASWPGKLLVRGNNCAKKLRAHKTEHLVGFLGRNHPKVPASWLQDVLYSPRGVAVFGTFDMLDRCWIWSRQITDPQHLKPLERALCLLKLMQSRNVSYDLEQKIYKMGQAEYTVPDPTYASLLFTDEALDFLRAMWLASDEPPWKCWQDLHRNLMPTYLNDDQMFRLFRVKWLEKSSFKPVHTDMIDRGLERFTQWFIQMQLRAKAGKLKTSL